MTDQTPTPESARALLDRHGLPEDVVDGALALHAQELAAVQRREAAVWGVDTAAGRHILGAADLIDPTRTAPAAVPVPPPADQTALRDRIAAAIRDAACPGDCGNTEEECARERIQPFAWHYGRLAIVEGTPEQFADAVLAVLPEQTDRAAVLLEAADALATARKVHSASGPNVNRRSPLRVQGMADAEALLRRMAADEQPTETAMFGSPDCTCIPFTRQTNPPRVLNRPTDTVNMISGWEIGRDCPHHKPAVGEQPETQEVRHLGGQANAEDCPACRGTNPPYPFLCPGPDAR